MNIFLGTIFTISQADMESLIGYMGDVFSDLAPLLLLIIGVSLGLLVVGVIIKSLRG